MILMRHNRATQDGWPNLTEIGRAINYKAPEHICHIAGAKAAFTETTGKTPDEVILTQAELDALDAELEQVWEEHNPDTIKPPETPCQAYGMILTITQKEGRK